MTNLHATNSINVEASVNNWFNTAINAITKPAWLPSLTLIFNLPDTPIVTPGISVYHMPVSMTNQWQGNHVGSGLVGGRAVNLMDVSCWVSRSATYSTMEAWALQLGTLRSMVQGVFAGTASIQLTNYTSDLGNPLGVAFKVDFIRLEAVATEHDPNPDIERARYLIRYEWTQRSVV